MKDLFIIRYKKIDSSRNNDLIPQDAYFHECSSLNLKNNVFNCCISFSISGKHSMPIIMNNLFFKVNFESVLNL